MHGAAGEFPDEPGVDGAKRQPALPRQGARAFHMLEQPRNFGGGKISVDDETRFAADGRGVAGRLEAVAVLGCAAVLPDDGVMDRSSGFAIPEQGGFSLVGDADGGNLLRGEFGLAQGGFGGGELGFPDRLGIMLHPSWFGENLREFLLRHGFDATGLIKDDASRACRSLI